MVGHYQQVQKTPTTIVSTPGPRSSFGGVGWGVRTEKGITWTLRGLSKWTSNGGLWELSIGAMYIHMGILVDVLSQLSIQVDVGGAQGSWQSSEV